MFNRRNMFSRKRKLKRRKKQLKSIYSWRHRRWRTEPEYIYDLYAVLSPSELQMEASSVERTMHAHVDFSDMGKLLITIFLAVLGYIIGSASKITDGLTQSLVKELPLDNSAKAHSIVTAIGNVNLATFDLVLKLTVFTVVFLSVIFVSFVSPFTTSKHQKHMRLAMIRLLLEENRTDD